MNLSRQRRCRGRRESISTPSHLSSLINPTPMIMNSIFHVSENYTGGGGDSSTIGESAIVFEKYRHQGYKE